MYTDINTVVDHLESIGISIEDPWDVVSAFEMLVADYAGSKYAVSVDSCTNAMF